MKRILIDSDICLDSITNRYPYSTEANRLLEYVEEGNCTGIISAESISNIFYILRKLSNSSKAMEQIRNLRKITEVGTIQSSTIDKAIDLQWNDFEDALQYICALESGCEAIITRNRNDSKKSLIPVLSAEEFLEQEII